MQTINISKNKYSEKDEGNSNHCNIEPSIQFPKTKQEALRFTIYFILHFNNSKDICFIAVVVF